MIIFQKENCIKLYNAEELFDGKQFLFSGAP